MGLSCWSFEAALDRERLSDFRNWFMKMTLLQRILFCGWRTAGLVVLTLHWAPLIGHAMTTNVVYQNYSFTPGAVTIHVGDTVVWTNRGGTHTVTGDGSDPFCGPDPVPVSCSVTFTKAGSFPYHCNFHGPIGMVGTVTVLPATGTNVLKITSATTTNGQLSLRWSGGSTPYLVQEKTSLSETNWANITTTTNLSATVPRTGAAGFFRVSGQAPGSISLQSAPSQPNPGPPPPR
jgi:plastocyanin